MPEILRAAEWRSIIPNMKNTFPVYPAYRRAGIGLYCVRNILDEGGMKPVNANEEAVAAVLANYQDALNLSDTNAVMRLYASDGVFMPQNFPSSVGADAVRKAYDAVFTAITLSVVFTIAEARQIAPEWAIARTNSSGTVKVHATGASSAEANQELFIFQKIDGAWKIARYCFSTTNPPRA